LNAGEGQYISVDLVDGDGQARIALYLGHVNDMMKPGGLAWKVEGGVEECRGWFQNVLNACQGKANGGWARHISTASQGTPISNGYVFMYIGERYEQSSFSADGGFWEAGLDHDGIHQIS